MLYAIFILLLIVFFPLLSLFLGLGLMAVIGKFWWVFLLLLIFGGLSKYVRSINERKWENKVRGFNLKKEKTPAIRLTYTGEADLSNDSYVLFIVKKYKIEKNDVLGKYVVNEKLYVSIDDALNAGHELSNLELEVRKKEVEVKDIKLAARRVAIKKMLLAVGLLAIAYIPGKVIFDYFESKSLEALATAQAIKDSSPHSKLFQIKIEGLLITKSGWGFIGDVSKNTGDFHPFLFPVNSSVGKKILATCSNGNYCKLSGSGDYIDLPKVTRALDIEGNSGTFEIIEVQSVSK